MASTLLARDTLHNRTHNTVWPSSLDALPKTLSVCSNCLKPTNVLLTNNGHKLCPECWHSVYVVRINVDNITATRGLGE